MMPSRLCLSTAHCCAQLRRVEKWGEWLTGFQITTQKLVTQKEFSRRGEGEQAVTTKRKWHLRLGRSSLREMVPDLAAVLQEEGIGKLPQHLSHVAAPPCRQLSMMLMLAQSNPQLFALIGTQANVTKELERVEHQSRLEQLSPTELQSKNTDHWKAWLQEYR